ncbi:MAG TPA: hypothetical protein PLI73_07605, partial [Candidatus Cloacimonadota bacterium]|nr:hypothetical protein [Candidatus Cloacimonadota bacterium]
DKALILIIPKWSLGDGFFQRGIITPFCVRHHIHPALSVIAFILSRRRRIEIHILPYRPGQTFSMNGRRESGRELEIFRCLVELS